VPTADGIPNTRRAPEWAVDRATDALPDSRDSSIIAERAWEIVRIADEQENERHDEYDDPDQGGEA
jgi:hypothetical protein